MDTMKTIMIIDSTYGPLALTLEDVQRALEKAVDLVPVPRPYPGIASAPTVSPSLIDSATLATMTSLPQTWLEEQARRKAIPSCLLGKYRRFEPEAVLDALKRLGRASPDLTPTVAGKRTRTTG